MSTAAVLIGLAMVIVAIPVVAGPVMNEKRERRFLEDTRKQAGAPEHYQEILAALQELEIDHHMGVVSEEDFGAARAQMLSEAAQALEVSMRDNGLSVDERIEAAVRERRQVMTNSGHSALACYYCGEALAVDDKFCTSCGTRAAAVCQSCGQQSRPGDRYCAGCGASVLTQVKIESGEIA